MPLAEVKVGLRPEPLDRRQEVVVEVADHPRRRAGQRAEEPLPLRAAAAVLAVEGLPAHEPSALGRGGERREDREDAVAARPAVGSSGVERNRVEDERPLALDDGRVARLDLRPKPLEDHRGEDLDPVADELRVPAQDELTVLAEPLAAGSLANHLGGAPIAHPLTHARQRRGHLSGRELVQARRRRPLVPGIDALALIALAVRRALPRQRLGETVRPSAVGRPTLVLLAPMAAAAIAAVEPHHRTLMTRTWTRRRVALLTPPPQLRHRQRGYGYPRTQASSVSDRVEIADAAIARV